MTEKEMADKRFEAGKAESTITPEKAKETSELISAFAREHESEARPSPIWEAWLREQMNNR